MFPYYYPTTTVVIDDDRNFLDSLGEALRREFLVREFNRAREGLDHLLQADELHLSQIAQLGGYLTSDGWPADGRDRLQLMLSSHVGQIRGRVERFEEVSVVILDLNMPEIDGLTICRALRRRPVRTILLTGNATERLALEAFNAGLIDRFVSKHEPTLVATVSQYIRELQQAYFRRVTTTIKETLSLGSLDFMMDPSFQRYFSQLCEDQDVVEYYARAYPPGVEIIRRDGRCWMLIVLTMIEVAERVAAARAAGADEDMVAQMERSAIITQFPSEGGTYEDRFCDSWKLYATEAHTIGSQSRWLASLVPATSIRPIGVREFLSLNDYVKLQDSF